MSLAIDDLCPPREPPPLLTEDQLVLLAHQGWLSLALPDSAASGLTSLFQELPLFFDKSNTEKASSYPAKDGTEFGYYNVNGEKEYITLRCKTHEASVLETKAAQVWKDAGALLYRILGDVARASELPFTVWDDILDGTMTLPGHERDMTGTLLRLFRYFPGSGIAGEHTDLGLLTLCIGGGKGLQLLDLTTEEPKWVDADGPIILVGKTLQILSQGLIRPGYHRVVANPEGRHSIVFALRHSTKHQIDLGAFGGEGSMDPKELDRKLKIGIVNINAKEEIRQKQKAKNHARKQRAPHTGG